MAQEHGTAPSWSIYLSPAILVLASLVWLWLYLSSDPLDQVRTLALIMMIVSLAGAGFRLYRARRKRDESRI